MKLLRLIFVPAAVIVFGGTMVFAWVPPAIAQDDSSAIPTAEISCRSNFGHPVELEKKLWSFVPATAEEIASVQKLKPEFSAGPFSEGTGPYDHVEIYWTKTKKDDADSNEATLSVFARAMQNQKGAWFKIVQDKGPGMVDYDFFDLTIGDTGDGSSESPDGNSSTGVSLVVKQIKIPLFEVAWRKRETGVSTFAEVRKMLLLDFRTLAPGITAVLQCVDAVGGGACGDFDNGAAPTTTLACNWDAAKADFLCTSTATGDYTVPLTHRFHLASDADAPYTVKEGDPTNLESLGSSSLLDRRLITKGADIPGLGHVSYLAQYSRDDIRGSAVLFASRGRDFLP